MTGFSDACNLAHVRSGPRRPDHERAEPGQQELDNANIQINNNSRYHRRKIPPRAHSYLTFIMLHFWKSDLAPQLSQFYFNILIIWN